MMLPFLTGCLTTQTGSNGFSVPKYSKEQRKEVHDELKNCPDCDRTIEFMKDYKVLRDQARIK